jgi:hypothetical protein
MRLRGHVIAAAAALVLIAAGACSKTPEHAAGAAPAKAAAPVKAKAAPPAKAAPVEPAPAAGTVKLPPTWPKDFPLPAGAAVTNTTENDGQVALEVTAPGTLVGVAEWYEKTMAAKAWKRDTKDAEAEHISLHFSRKGGTAAVSLNPGDPGKVALSLTWRVATEE